MTIIVTVMEVMDERGFQGEVEEVELPVQMLDVIISEYIYIHKYYVILFLSMDKNHNMKDEMAKSLGSSPGVMSAKTGSLWWGM